MFATKNTEQVSTTIRKILFSKKIKNQLKHCVTLIIAMKCGLSVKYFSTLVKCTIVNDAIFLYLSLFVFKNQKYFLNKRNSRQMLYLSFYTCNPRQTRYFFITKAFIQPH